MYVMSISITSFGGLCGRSNSCSASMQAAIPSACGMFVYRLVTSMVKSMVCGGSCMDSIRLINCLLSFMYDGVAFIAGCSRESIKLDMRSVGPSQPETMGRSFLGSLCILRSM